MNIIIVCYPTFGGSGVVATELGMSLVKKGHQIHFVTYRNPVRLVHFSKNIYFHEVSMEDYPLFEYQPYEMALSSKIVEVVKKYNIGIIHAHYAIPHAYVAYMAKKMLKNEGVKVSIVTTLHGTDITLVGNHPYYKTAVKFSIEESDVVTAVSESLKKDTVELFDIKKEIKVIPNFINMQQYSQRPTVCKRSMVAQSDEIIFIHVSNFRKVKRIEDVVEFFYKFRKHKKAKLVMAGDGPEREPAEQMCQRLEIGEDVIFLGNYLNIKELLCFSDIFLLPSQAESFGLAALEAMAMGVPVISSNAGGLSEVNQHGYSGFLSQVGDTDDMVRNALHITQDKETLSKFKENAKKRASVFDDEKIIPLYEDLYWDM